MERWERWCDQRCAFGFDSYFVPSQPWSRPTDIVEVTPAGRYPAYRLSTPNRYCTRKYPSGSATLLYVCVVPRWLLGCLVAWLHVSLLLVLLVLFVYSTRGKYSTLRRCSTRRIHYGGPNAGTSSEVILRSSRSHSHQIQRDRRAKECRLKTEEQSMVQVN